MRSFIVPNFSLFGMNTEKQRITQPAITCSKLNNRNTRTRFEICSKLTTKTTGPRQWRHNGVFIVNFEHISNLVLVFLLLILSR